VLGVHPEVDERLPRRGFALRDLVLVVRKDVVDGARVDVEMLPEDGQEGSPGFAAFQSAKSLTSSFSYSSSATRSPRRVWVRSICDSLP